MLALAVDRWEATEEALDQSGKSATNGSDDAPRTADSLIGVLQKRGVKAIRLRDKEVCERPPSPKHRTTPTGTPPTSLKGKMPMPVTDEAECQEPYGHKVRKSCWRSFTSDQDIPFPWRSSQLSL